MLIFKELSKNKYKNKTIADLGCGEAFLGRNLKQKVYSFDLVKINEHIIQSDLKNLPLEDNFVDIAIFCLSLMGSNFIEFIVEARRVLKQNGILIVCEITSRIVNADNFVKVFERLGFSVRVRKSIKNYFTLFVFRLRNKNVNKINVNEVNSSDILKPCLYKRR
jgi:ribosomal RNA-processing protein 8